MTTLTGEKLFNYLSSLEIKARSLDENHDYLAKVIGAEKLFLQKYHSTNGTGPSLSFSGNGLPSLESLKPDLEKMCELTEDKELFGYVAQRFRKDIENVDKEKYEIVDRKKYSEKEKSLENKTLTKEVFSFEETEDRALSLVRREETYIDSIDEYSQNTPVLIRDSKTNYKIIFGELMNHTSEEFFGLRENALAVYGSRGLERRMGGVDLEAVGNIVRKTYNFARISTKFALTSTFVYPTFLRSFNNDKDYEALNESGVLEVSGLFPNVAMFSISVFGNQGIFILPFLVSLSTNIASGLYEWYRYEKNKKYELTDKELYEKLTVDCMKGMDIVKRIQNESANKKLNDDVIDVTEDDDSNRK